MQKDVYEKFLKVFPLCVVYWQHYGTAAEKNTDVATTREIYERGLRFSPTSCELWFSFILFLQPHVSEDEMRLFDFLYSFPIVTSHPITEYIIGVSHVAAEC